MSLTEKDKKRLGSKWWRLNHLYWIKNKDKQLVQFKLNKVQRHFSKNVHTRNIILKSRQLGFTSLEVIDMLDDCLFTRNFDGLLIAQDLDTAKDIFDNKVYLAWNNFKLQKLYSVDMSSARRIKLSFGDGTESSITVSVSGRAGTYARLHITEFAKVARERPDKAQEIFDGSIPAVPKSGRVDIESTAQGTKDMFADLFWQAWKNKDKKLLSKEFKAHFYNWQWDEEIETIKVIPDLPSEFRDYQKTYSLTDKEISYYYQCWISLNKNWESLKREYPSTPEEAFAAAIQGAYYSQELALARQENRIINVDYDDSLQVHTVWDLGVSDATAIGFFQKVNQEVRLIDYYEDAGKGLSHYIKVLQNKNYIYGYHFAPHDIKVREFTTGKSRLEIANDLGISFEIVPNMSLADGINAGRMMFRRLWIDEKKCQQWIDYIAQYKQSWNEKRGCFEDKPYHDFTSHAADVLRYAALSENNFITYYGESLPKQDDTPIDKYAVI